MPNLDAQIFQWINTLPDSPLTVTLFYIHYLSFVWLAFITIFLWVKFPDKRKSLIRTVSVALFTYGFCFVLKYLIDRPRPAETIPDVIVRANYYFPSFPSDQAATFLAFAILLALFFQKKLYTVPTFTIVALIAISRIYLGAHYPSDVLGGMVVGTLVPLTYYYVIFKRKTTKK